MNWSAHCDVLYYKAIRWLSRGRVLRRFYELLPEINALPHSKDKIIPHLIEPEWSWHLAFLTDVTEMLNSLNLQLQGLGKLVCDMYSHIKAFGVKPALLLEQVKKHNFIHLPATQNLSAENPVASFPAEKCVEAMEILKAEQNCDVLKDAFKFNRLTNCLATLSNNKYPCIKKKTRNEYQD